MRILLGTERVSINKTGGRRALIIRFEFEQNGVSSGDLSLRLPRYLTLVPAVAGMMMGGVRVLKARAGFLYY
jgi:hypothetical protein